MASCGTGLVDGTTYYVLVLDPKLRRYIDDRSTLVTEAPGMIELASGCVRGP